MNPPRVLASCILAQSATFIQSRDARSPKSHTPEKTTHPGNRRSIPGANAESLRAQPVWPRPRAVFALCVFYRLASVTAPSPNTHFASGVGLTRAASTRLRAPSVARSEPRTVHHGRCAAAAVAAALMSLVCVYVFFITPRLCRRARANARDVYVTTVTNTFRHYQPAIWP